MRVLTHGTVIQCPHGVPAVIPRLGHHLAIAGTAALTAEEIELATVACADVNKCVKFTVTAGKARHLTTSGGAAPTPVLEALKVKTNAGECTVQTATGSLSARGVPAEAVAAARADEEGGASGEQKTGPTESITIHVFDPDLWARALDAFPRTAGKPMNCSALLVAGKPLSEAVREYGEVTYRVIQRDGGCRVILAHTLPASGPAPVAGSAPPAAGESASVPLSLLTDEELGREYGRVSRVLHSGTDARRDEIETEIEKRGYGTAQPRGLSPRFPANAAVTPEIGLDILENASRGEPPFRPESGRGGTSWFVTEGKPYTAASEAKSITVEVQVRDVSGRLVFDDAKLAEMFSEQRARTGVEAETTFRARYGLSPDAPLSHKMSNALARFKRGFAEARMWESIGEQVRSSASKVGEVIFGEGSRFSRQGPGRFAVVADPKVVTLRGGPEPLLNFLEKQGVSAEQPVVEAAREMSKKLKWAGRVRAVFRHGGRLLIIVGGTRDVIRIIRAKGEAKVIITTAAGWGGATLAGAAFAAWWTPADAAGPLAWAAHGVGTLIAGGVGYWVGSETTRTIYELILE